MRSAFLPALLLTSIVGCGPRWNVIRQANPNPLSGTRTFALDGVHYDTLRVGGKSEAEYLAGKSGEQQASFQSDKQSFQQKFGESLVTDAEGLLITGMPPKDEKTFAVVPFVTFFEPGFYAGVAHGDTEVEIDVKVLTPKGELVDEITIRSLTIRSHIPATLTSPSSGDRLRKAGDDLGGVVAKYLKTRSGLGS